MVKPAPAFNEIERFLLDLSEVSYRHGLAISDSGIVHVMELEDYELRYFLDGNTALQFKR